MNTLYGIRFPKSYKSEEAWKKINRFGSKQMILWSFPLFMSGIIFLVMPPFTELFTTMLVFLPCITILPPVVVSYFYSTKI
ncbi:SdpI family protein [Rossellomorea sp. SC111]|uniref:SdpI family protein n=1 Tax=Rossellomorea sp. SC111 TaxID=2968985 RepID=UPI0035C6A673